MAIRSLFVEIKQIPVTFVEALKKAKNLREEADYYNRWSKEGCEELLSAAEDSFNKAKQIVSLQE